MRLVAEIRERLRALLRREREDRELAEELRSHLEMETEANVRRGSSAEEARRQARLRLGGLAQVEEATRDARGVRWLEDLVWDVRYALRTFVKRPAFTAAVVATLALGIGPNTVLFGIVDALFVRAPAGVRDAGDVVRLSVVRDEGSIRTGNGGPGSYVDYEALRDHARGFASVAAVLFPQDVDLGRGERAERVRGRPVTWTYFPLLGVRPALGRFFLPEEDSIAGAHPVAVLSHGFWERRFGGDPGIVGKALLLNGQPVTVVGVAEAAFTGTDTAPVDVWVPTALAGPLKMMPAWVSDRGVDWRRSASMAALRLVARLAPGVGERGAEAEAVAVLTRAAAEAPTLDPTPGVLLSALTPVPLGSGLALVALTVIFLPTTIVLLIACANVANLLLARGTARRRETAVRAALGAGRGRLVRQHLAESVVLGFLGGVGGLALAAAAGVIARRFPVPPHAIEINVRVLAYALGVSLLTGVIFGLLPALRSARTAPAGGLKDADAGLHPGRGRMRRALVAFQVALSLVLLAGAGLQIRSLREVDAIEAGLDIERLLIVSVDLSRAGYDSASREVLYDSARERVLRVVGVEAAALAQFTPLDGSVMSVSFEAPGADTSLIREGPYFNWVGADYFATVGTRVLRGRDFTELDRVRDEPVAVVNEPMARIFAPRGDPLGRCMLIGDQDEGSCTRIVGIVEASRHAYLEEAGAAQIYVSRDHDPAAAPTTRDPVLLVRTRGRPVDAARRVRAAVQGVAANLPYVSVRPFEEMLRWQVGAYRLSATLFTLFGVLALLIAAVGLYGVLGYFVAERTVEIGIRRSLGAGERGVVGLVVRQGMVPVAIGLGIGLAVALAAGRLAEALLYGVSGSDPLTFAAAAALLAAVSLVASYLPARRAARVDPMIALRAE